MGSLWEATTSALAPPALAGALEVEVAIVGGGLTGLTLAYALARQGKRVALFEKGASVGSGNSIATTAHLTQVFDVPLPELVRLFGAESATLVWRAGQEAIAFIEGVCARERLEAGFGRVPGYRYAAEPSGEDALKEEALLAHELGFDARYMPAPPHPWIARGALAVPDQARFQPGRYMAGLAEAARRLGARLYGGSRVTAFERGEPARLTVNGHAVTAGAVVFASHQPLFHDHVVMRLVRTQTYALAARLGPEAAVPDALGWDTAEPYHYWRFAAEQGARQVAFGGADHPTGEAPTTDPHRALAAALAKLMGGRAPEVTHRWSGQILESADRLPLFGRDALTGAYLATGYAGNGMTFGTYAALRLAEQILGREHPSDALFAPGRFKLRAGAVTFLREGLKLPVHFFADYLGAPSAEQLPELALGEGRVVDLAGRKVACCKTPDGTAHAVSALCTHMGCLVSWNASTASWDCPCHGSRYAPDGAVIAGPAVQPLAAIALPAISPPGLRQA